MYSKVDPASVRTRTYIAICGNASINTNGHGTITSPYTVIHRVCGEEGKTIDKIDWQIGVRLVLYTVWESPVHELKRIGAPPHKDESPYTEAHRSGPSRTQ